MFLSVLLGCAGAPPVAPPPPRPHTLVPGALSDASNGLQVATSVTLDGQTLPIGYEVLARTGDPLGDGVFGARTSRSGAPLPVCEGLDYTGLWPTAAGLSMITHFECQPGALYVTDVEASAAGQLRATSTRAIDTRPVDGGNFYCAGAPTRWDTHLAAQEYEGDVRKLLPDGTLSDDFEGYNTLAAWWDGDLAAAHPWMYGWVVELPAPGPPEQGPEQEGPPARRWAMGRFSHEMALAMPDDRTVYLTDDAATGGSLFLFQADRPRDLTSGTLWAARWAPGRGVHDYALSWVSLGHANDAEVEALVARRVAFDTLFAAAAPTGITCPDRLTFVRTSWGPECLAFRPGMEAVAGRLEARRAAALAGATTELVKTEGMAFSPEDNRLFLAMTRFEDGATAAHPEWDLGGRDDVRLPANRCGGVWSLELGTESGPQDSGPAGPAGPSGPHVARAATLLLAGIPDGEGCRADAIANPDNLAWIEGADTLAIAEDTSHHANNVLWLYDLGRRALLPALQAPPGAEVSGLRWTPGVAGWSYLSVAVQHPYEGVADAPAGATRSMAGVLGPFPAWE